MAAPDGRRAADDVLAILRDAGMLSATIDDPRVHARVREMLRGYLEPDYIPRDSVPRPGRSDMINPREAPPGLRCAAVIGDDEQSGPLYCGREADLIMDSRSRPELSYVLCRSHFERIGFTLKAIFP